MVPPYAVVSFVKDHGDNEQVTSEILSCWLSTDKKKCWWPRAKNINYLILKTVLPDPDNSSKWALHDVIFENYYDTLEEARKRAEVVSSSDEIDHQTINKSRTRKRKSTSLKTVPESSDDEEVLNIKNMRLPSPPHDLNVNNIFDDIPIIFDKSEENLQGTPLVIAEYKSDFEPIKASSSSTPIMKPKVLSSEILQKPLKVAFRSQQIMSSAKSSPSPILNTYAESDSDTLTTNDLRTSASGPTLRQFIDNRFDALLRKVAEISVTLEAVKESVIKIQNRSIEKSCTNPALDDVETRFPFRNRDEVMKFEANIENTISRSHVILCLKKVRGYGMKESLIRILKKVFSNKLAKESSWLGQRGNLKISNLTITNCIKETISSRCEHTDKEFEEVASEWFRQANQRYLREVSKASNEKKATE